MKNNWYAYRDIATGKVKRTRGRFVGFTDPTGPFLTCYAIFQNERSTLYVPQRDLTAETRADLAELRARLDGADK